MILSAGFTFQLGIENWIIYGLFTFFSTLAVYNGQRLFKSEQPNKTPWLSWVKHNEKPLIYLVILASISALVCVIFIIKINWITLLILSMSGIISALYVIKVRGRNMREIPYLKIHLIAIAWTLILVVFPIVNESINVSAVYYGFAHYLFVLGVTIPFDIRDLKYDSVDHRTIPQVIGVKSARGIAVLSIVSFTFLMLLIIPGLRQNLFFYAAVIIQLILINAMNEKRSDLYCAGLIDGAIALLGLSYFF